MAGSPIVFGVVSFTLDRNSVRGGGVRLVGVDAAAAERAIDDLTPAVGAQVRFLPVGGDQVPTLLGTVPLGREVE